VTDSSAERPSHKEFFANPNNAAEDRMAALLAIVEHYSPDDYNRLVKVLTDTNEDKQLRSSVAIAFGKLINNYTVQSLLQEREGDIIALLSDLSKTDEEPLIRAYCVTALGMTGKNEAIKPVIAALSDEDLKVFHNAAEALPKFNRAIIPHLIEQLNDGENDAKCVAAWKLGEMGYAEGIEPLLKTVAAKGIDEEVLALAIWALGEIGYRKPEVVEALQQAITHPLPQIHERAQLALKKVARNAN
jgi:HEAT repeat protein